MVEGGHSPSVVWWRHTIHQPPVIDAATAKSEKPWLALSATLIGLFGSVGLNGYLGWILLELRGRHRRLLVSRIDDAALNTS